MAEKKRVLFVCLGNICRSPVGEAALRKMAEDRNLAEAIEIDSAGTIDYHAGELPDPRMREAAGRRGYRLESRSRQITREDLERFDLIVAMDRDNHADIKQLDPYDRFNDKIRLLCDFIPKCPHSDVPDPYYGGRRGFDQVIDLVEEGARAILDELANELEGSNQPELTA
jgi:protein-tyrosine phosphatase